MYFIYVGFLDFFHLEPKFETEWIRAEAETCFLQRMNKTLSMIVNISVHTKVQSTKATKIIHYNYNLLFGPQKLLSSIVFNHFLLVLDFI